MSARLSPATDPSLLSKAEGRAAGVCVASGGEISALQLKRRPGGRSGALARILRTTSNALC